jgi:two-component system sensor histidine kinase KdpD
VALVVSRFVDIAARRSADAARARANAATLARLAATAGETDPLPALLHHLRTVFRLDSAAVLTRDGRQWRIEASDGDSPPSSPDDAALALELSDDSSLALNGPRIAARDQFVLKAFAAQLASVREHNRLRAEAATATALAEANELRGALLQAVSHDLRTPLASIKASVTSLCQPDVNWDPDATAEFLHTIDAETDRLTKLVENLLDMSRINARTLRPVVRDVALEEVVPAALASLGQRAAEVDDTLSEELPAVLADAGLLERVVANVVDNAVRANAQVPSAGPVTIGADVVDERIELHVVDHGPGIPKDQRGVVFRPFQRLGDAPHGTGVGLGLAVARGFATAMGATISISDTPGGGSTVTISLRVAR